MITFSATFTFPLTPSTQVNANQAVDDSDLFHELIYITIRFLMSLQKKV